MATEKEAQQQQVWNDDEVVDNDWVGGLGAVGDKNSGLHRQASLPTRYNRGTHDLLRSCMLEYLTKVSIFLLCPQPFPAATRTARPVL